MADLSALAPPGAVLVPVFDTGQDLAIHPDEAALVARAVEKRRRDFALGRTCAHAALTVLEEADAVIGQAASGAPLWPPGVVGSITHTRGFAAALAGRGGDFRGLGLDAERTAGMRDELAPRLFGASEMALLSDLDAVGRRVMATLLFSAKESYYKVFHPLTGQRLDFHQVEIVPDGNGFTARQPGAGGWTMAGRFAVLDDLVVTAIGLPR